MRGSVKGEAEKGEMERDARGVGDIEARGVCQPSAMAIEPERLDLQSIEEK